MKDIQRLTIPKKIGPYTFYEMIGIGSTSDVYRVENNSISLCCKVISKKRFWDSTSIKHFRSELINLSQFNHQNIIKIIDVLQDSINFYIITEFCSKGSLDKHIIKLGKLEESSSKFIFKQIILGLLEIHNKQIAHRDIKAENILLSNNLLVKLGDFGFSSETTQNLKTFCGTLNYCSPEIVNRIPYDGIKSDMWSCGILLYTIVTGKFPWTVRNHAAIIDQVKAGYIGIPSGISNECVDLIHKLTSLDPYLRPSCEEVLNHSWLINIKIPNFLEFNYPIFDIKKIDDLFENKDGWKMKLTLTSFPSIYKNSVDVQVLLKSCSRQPKRRKSDIKCLNYNNLISKTCRFSPLINHNDLINC